MKEKYEALKMEVISFDAEIMTATADGYPDDVVTASDPAPEIN